MTDLYTQARIRINEEGATETLEALYQREEFLRDARGAISAAEGRKEFNRRLSSLRRVITELERTRLEQGWVVDGEPEQPHET